jgi:predicted site-specific integrase-resolvase
MFVRMQKNPRLIGSAQAAKILGVDRATLSRWCQAGDVPVAYDPGTRTGARLFDVEAIEQLAAERQREKASA